MSTAIVMIDGTQRHGRGTDDIIQGLDRDPKVVNGREMITVSRGEATIFEIEVARRTGGRSIGGAMTSMIGRSAGDDAHIELVQLARHPPAKKLR